MTSRAAIVAPLVRLPTYRRQKGLVGFSGLISTRAMSQIKHIVMFNFKEETSADTIQMIQDGLLNLPKEISTIQDYELGIDMLLESGQKHPAGKNRLLCWSCTFETVDDYENYSIHPVHVELLDNYIKPNLLPGSRAAIQYEVKDKH